MWGVSPLGMVNVYNLPYPVAMYIMFEGINQRSCCTDVHNDSVSF